MQLSEALAAEFPRMVFRVSLWDAHGDRMYPNPPEPVAASARRVSRLPPEWPDPKYRFASHLTDHPERYGMYGLLAPEGWTPVWKEAADRRYNTADPAHGKFARRCKRIFFKYMTNRFARVNREIGKARFRNDGGEFRVGFHALKRAAAHPRQFAGEDMKPDDWQPPGA